MKKAVKYSPHGQCLYEFITSLVFVIPIGYFLFPKVWQIIDTQKAIIIITTLFLIAFIFINKKRKMLDKLSSRFGNNTLMLVICLIFLLLSGMSFYINTKLKDITDCTDLPHYVFTNKLRRFFLPADCAAHHYEQALTEHGPNFCAKLSGGERDACNLHLAHRTKYSLYCSKERWKENNCESVISITCKNIKNAEMREDCNFLLKTNI